MPELRWHPLLGQWVAVAGQRQERTYKPPADACPLCPSQGPTLDHPTEVPVADFDIAVFENRFPALLPDPPPPEIAGSTLSPVAPAQGVCEVVVYSPDHDRTLAEQPVAHLRKLVEVWAHRYEELSRRPYVKYVMIFENRGEAVGVTLHHPHGQIYAFPFIPPIPQQELQHARMYHTRTGRCVLCDVLAEEWRYAGAPGESGGTPPGAHRLPDQPGGRLVVVNDAVAVFVPAFARFPFETLVLPRRHLATLPEMTNDERWELAAALKGLLGGYDRLFGFRLPYMMVMHQAPTQETADLAGACHFHIEFLPIQRTATKLKYLAGSESGAGMFITDASPEEMAERLREAVR